MSLLFIYITPFKTIPSISLCRNTGYNFGCKLQNNLDPIRNGLCATQLKLGMYRMITTNAIIFININLVLSSLISLSHYVKLILTFL